MEMVGIYVHLVIFLKFHQWNLYSEEERPRNHGEMNALHHEKLVISMIITLSF